MNKILEIDKFNFIIGINKYYVTFSKVEKSKYNNYYAVESNYKKIVSKVFNTRIKAFLYFDFLRANYEQ